MLAENLPAHLAGKSWPRPPLFSWLQEQGNVAEAEMLRVFNCGIGMIVIVAAADAKVAAETLRAAGETVWQIGSIAARRRRSADRRCLIQRLPAVGRGHGRDERMKKVVILISGRGSNIQAILEARLPVTVAAVISNDAAAGGLATAKKHGVATQVVDHRGFADRAAFDRALAAAIDAHAPDLVVLAGFMRILTAEFVEHYRGRILNIHPSLLPSFTGLHTHRRALDAGVKAHGCSVHFVTPELDHGPIVAQAVHFYLHDTEYAAFIEALRDAGAVVVAHAVGPWRIRDHGRESGVPGERGTTPQGARAGHGVA